MVHKDPRFSRAEAVRCGAALVPDARMEVETGVLQNTDAESHAQLRRVFADHFGHGQEARWTDIIRREADTVLAGRAPGDVFDLRAEFFEPVARRSAETIIGLPMPQDPRILELIFDGRLMLDLQARLRSALRRREGLVEGSVLEHLGAAVGEGLISEIDLINNLLVIVAATYQGMGGPFLGGLFALLRDRSQWETCLQDRSVLPNAVEEMLRCYPNGDGQFLRVATEDVVLSGVTIRRGEAVLAPVAAADADPEVFPDPRRFDVRRPNSQENLAFGTGTHFCLGWLLAKVWMQTALAALLERLPSLHLAADPDLITYRPSPLMNIMDRLPVKC
jgi:nocardicin N-oxygenase